MGGQGGDSPPPNFTHCLHNELHCSIVDGIAYVGIVPQGNHIIVVLKKMSPPKSEHLPMPMLSPHIQPYAW